MKRLSLDSRGSYYEGWMHIEVSQGANRCDIFAKLLQKMTDGIPVIGYHIRGKHVTGSLLGRKCRKLKGKHVMRFLLGRK